MSAFTTPEGLIALLTLTLLEIVLGIDNVVFISILAGKLPAAQQARARQVGLGLAAITRVGLLFSLAWLIGLTDPWFSVFGFDFSGRDLILLGGGLFLIAKATFEIHEKLEGHGGAAPKTRAPTFSGVVVQILLLDVVFSLDSVITAVGIADDLPIMIAAVLIAVGVMVASSGPLSAFVERHPTVKMLALSFLLLIGFTLVVEGFHFHLPKGYVYVAMGFSVFVEMLNLRMRSAAPVPLKHKGEPVAPRAPHVD